MEVSGQLHDPADLLPGKEFLVHIGQEAGWAPESVWTRSRGVKLPAPTGIRTPVIGKVIPLLSDVPRHENISCI
jgi:hypothetical protein